MNFTTDLPKRNPLVSYIVASAVRCEKFFPDSTKPGPVYRMHAVILKENGIKLSNNPQEDGDSRRQLFELYICCHLRRVEIGEGDGDGGDEKESPGKQEVRFADQISPQYSQHNTVQIQANTQPVIRHQLGRPRPSQAVNIK